MTEYIALIHKEPKSDFGVSFPDFPGCVTAGSTLDEARANAVEALAFHLDGMIEDGESLPEPSDLDTVMRERVNRDAVAAVVDVPRRRPPTVRVNITLSEDVLHDIDAYAERAGYTRSGLFATAARALTDFSLNPMDRTILHMRTNTVWSYDDEDNIVLKFAPPGLDQEQLRALEEDARHRLHMERSRRVRGGWADLAAGRVVSAD